MKNNCLAQPLVLLLSCLLTVMLGCKKTETVTPIQQHSADFSVMVVDTDDPFHRNNLVPALSALVDSNFYFFNKAFNTVPSGDKLSYHWDFGDGASSTEKSPKHIYAKRGTYTVTHIVSNERGTADTSSQKLTVNLGRRFISIGDAAVSLVPTAIVETETNEFMMAAVSYKFPYLYQSCYLFQLDSSLKQKSVKTFPSTHRFSTIAATNDGNYILTGSTQAEDKYDEMIKMTSNGTLIWNKVLFAGDIYSDVVLAPDGGYVVVGSRLYQAVYGLTYHTVVIKTDHNGNVQWQKELGAEGMTTAEKGVVEEDGIVIAGIKRGSCIGCDSISIIKLNINGNIDWKSALLKQQGYTSGSSTNIAKLTDGSYAVTNGYEIFFFSSSGSFLNRKLVDSYLKSVMNASGGAIFLRLAGLNGFIVSKLRLDGVQQWAVNQLDSYPLSIQPLRRGGILVTGSYVSAVIAGNNKNDVLLMQLDEAGKLK